MFFFSKLVSKLSPKSKSRKSRLNCNTFGCKELLYDCEQKWHCSKTEIFSLVSMVSTKISLHWIFLNSRTQLKQRTKTSSKKSWKSCEVLQSFSFLCQASNHSFCVSIRPCDIMFPVKCTQELLVGFQVASWSMRSTIIPRSYWFNLDLRSLFA